MILIDHHNATNTDASTTIGPTTISTITNHHTLPTSFSSPSTSLCLDEAASSTTATNVTNTTLLQLLVSLQTRFNGSTKTGLQLPSATTSLYPCNISFSTLAEEALEEAQEVDPGHRGGEGGGGEVTFLFDRGDVRGILIALYTVVFITGFVGNLVVLVVLWVHPRMRSTTNFFLTNLAIADFCVTVFCVYQNLSQYLAQTWIFGDFLCKMYNFVHYLSYTASVMILVVNCVERYVAIMRPFRAKTLLSHRNLVASLAVVWVGSGVYCCPRLLYFRAGSHELSGAQYTEVICLADRELYDSRTFDTINFVLLYVIPLTVMSLLYWRIGRYLWINGRQMEEARGALVVGNGVGGTPIPNAQPPCCISALNQEMLKEDKLKEDGKRSGGVKVGGGGSSHHSGGGGGAGSSSGCHSTHSGGLARRRQLRSYPNGEMSIGPYHYERLIRTWRKVVKLLVAVVLCFALCNLPFHLRKMLTYYHPGYDPTTNAALIFTPISNLLMYLNSALNPIVYSFMSHNFRACVRDVLNRYTRRGKQRRRRNPSGPLPFQRGHQHVVQGGLQESPRGGPRAQLGTGGQCQTDLRLDIQRHRDLLP